MKGNATVWDPGSSAGNWDSFFAQPNGSLARSVSQLILVTDFDLEVTSTAKYSDSEYQKIQAQANFGIWPFFSASASSTHTATTRHSADTSLTTKYKTNPGVIQIWGVSVQQQT